MPERLPVDGYPQQEISFAERIGAWQNLLNGLPKNSPDRARYEQEALDNLNGQWRHTGEDCMISGQACTGLISEDDGRVLYATFATADGHSAVSDGFGLFTFIEEGVATEKIAYTFRGESSSPITISSPNGIEYTTQVVYALNPSDCSILFSGDVDATLNVRSLVQQQSDELASFMRSPEFLIMHTEEQQAVIDRYVTETWQQMCVLQPGLQTILCEASQAYTLEPTEQAALRFHPLAIAGELIEGGLLGLEVLETQRLALGKALRRSEEFIDEHAGLCLAVMPNEATAKRLGLMVGQDLLYIPVSSQDIDLVISQNSVSAS